MSVKYICQHNSWNRVEETQQLQTMLSKRAKKGNYIKAKEDKLSQECPRLQANRHQEICIVLWANRGKNALEAFRNAVILRTQLLRGKTIFTLKK